jgi:hypothetical protein
MILQYQVKYLDRAAPMATYELAQSILFHILIEEREKVSSYTHFKIV